MTIFEPLDGLLLALGRQGRTPSAGSMAARSLTSSTSRSMRSSRCLIGVGAHAALEVLAVAVAELAPQHLVLDDLAGEEVAELVEGALEQVDLGVELLADGGEVLLGGPLAGAQLGLLGALGLEARPGSASSCSWRLARASSRSFSMASRSPMSSASRLGEVLVAAVLVDPGDAGWRRSR